MGERRTVCVTDRMASAMRYGFAMANVARRCSSFSSSNNSRRLFQLSRSRLAVGVACRAAVQRTLSSYATKVEGAADSEDFRVFLTDASGKAISPWHDVPLYADEGKGTVNFFCEIPKETSAKMECATDEPKNPIKQDTKKGKLRFYPYNINWNYGLLPQTWEDPAVAHPELEVMGDNDPVDVVEVGSAPCEIGGVYKVKPIGALAMIDDGEQ